MEGGGIEAIIARFGLQLLLLPRPSLSTRREANSLAWFWAYRDGNCLVSTDLVRSMWEPAWLYCCNKNEDKCFGELGGLRSCPIWAALETGGKNVFKYRHFRWFAYVKTFLKKGRNCHEIKNLKSLSFWLTGQLRSCNPRTWAWIRSLWCKYRRRVLLVLRVFSLVAPRCHTVY